jgi:hypothetical protein
MEGCAVTPGEFPLTRQGIRNLDAIPGRSRGRRLPEPPRQPPPRVDCPCDRLAALDANHDECLGCGRVFSYGG